MKTEKTNAARLLDAAGIEYELVPYSYSEEDLSAESVAAELGEPIEQVFKTLVLRGDKTKEFVCVIPGDMEVDLKVAAKISGNKNCEMLHGIHSRRLLSDRNEKAFPELHSRERAPLRLHLHKRRKKRSADKDKSTGPHRLR